VTDIRRVHIGRRLAGMFLKNRLDILTFRINIVVTENPYNAAQFFWHSSARF
jgi:hypothetical protein